MITIRPKDLIHKSYLNRILIEIIDNPNLSQNIAFKGGTCASMLGFLDRFSVDLDFDLVNKNSKTRVQQELQNVFKKMALIVARKNDQIPFFQVKYPSRDPRQRNSIKISVTDNVPTTNNYRTQYLTEIDRLINCQTIETMFANKLVAVTDRYNIYKTVAGRDIYDIHHFFTQGYSYNSKVIKERTGLESKDYFSNLFDFIEKHVNQTIINEDLNSLLNTNQFQQIRKILIPETLHLLAMERSKLEKND